MAVAWIGKDKCSRGGGETGRLRETHLEMSSLQRKELQQLILWHGHRRCFMPPSFFVGCLPSRSELCRQAAVGGYPSKQRDKQSCEACSTRRSAGVFINAMPDRRQVKSRPKPDPYSRKVHQHLRFQPNDRMMVVAPQSRERLQSVAVLQHRVANENTCLRAPNPHKCRCFTTPRLLAPPCQA